MHYVIGIDIGTGSTKAIAMDTRGTILYTRHASYPTLVPHPDYSEQAPGLIWQAFVKCVSEVIMHLGHQPQAISLSSAMHSVIPVNDHGEPLMNMITWADNRSAAIATRIKNSAPGKLLYEQTGTPLHPMSPFCKIIWLRENMPDIFKATKKYISIKEFIWFKLFGVFEVDHSIASATGLFDIIHLKWNDNALRHCEISPAELSVPVSTSFSRREVLASVRDVLSVSEQVPFFIGASDGCMANLGSLAIAHGTAALTIGTSGAIRVASKTPTVDFAAMNFNYRLDEETFISGGPINNGGVILKWYAEKFLKKTLSSGEDYDDILNDLKTTPPGADGLIFLPYLLGERAPIWNSDSCGMFFGMRTRHTQEHFTRAVLEGICMALFHIGNTMEEAGLVIERINVSGGFVRSHDWLQLLADIFGKPVILIREEDASAIGAIYLAMKGCSMIASYDQLLNEKPLTFVPDLNHHKIYVERNFPLYKNLYRHVMLDMAIWNEAQSSADVVQAHASNVIKS